MSEREMPESTSTQSRVNATLSRLESALNRTDRMERLKQPAELSDGTMNALDDQFSRLNAALAADHTRIQASDGEEAIRRAAEDVCAALAKIARD